MKKLNGSKRTPRKVTARGDAPRGKLAATVSLSRLDYLLIATVFVVALIGALLGEKVAVSDGLGWDGRFYGTMAKNFSISNIFALHIDAYRIQRVFPAAFMHYALRLFQAPLTTPNIVLGFALLGVALLTLSSLFWCLICNRMKINPGGKLVGFLGVFGSFALTKWLSFYPVLTDVPAFALSIGMLYFYLSNNRACLLLLTIVGAFTWPTLLYQGVLFLLFPRDNSNMESQWSPAPHHRNAQVALVTSVALLLGLLWALFHHHAVSSHEVDYPLGPPYEPLLPVSILVALLFWFYALAPLLDRDRFFAPKYWISQVRPATWLVVLLCGLGIKIVQRVICSSAAPHVHTMMLVRNILIESVVTPGKFYVAHIFFFGPIAVLALFWWKPITRFVQIQGLGLVLNVILGLFFFLASQSRQAITFFPLFILPVAQVAGSFRWRARTLGLFAVLTIVSSRVWLPLNGDSSVVARLFSLLLPNHEIANSVYPENPNIFFWASVGTWTSHAWYILEAVIAVVVGCLLYLCIPHLHASERAPNHSE